MPLLTAALVTRDDAATIEPAIRSVATVAAQVLVADTGSTDATVTLARAAGAEVVEVAWDEDVAAARNALLPMVQGDWILWLRPDEVWQEPDRAGLVDALSSDSAFGLWVTIQHPGPGGPPCELVEPRLCRARPDLAFEGRLNPRFATELVERVRAEGFGIEPSPVTLRSLNTDRPLSAERLRFEEQVLARELTEQPGLLPEWIEYGRILLLLGDPRGHQAMARALDLVLPRFEDPSAPSWAVQVLLEYLLSLPPGPVRPRLGRAGARELARRWFPESPRLEWVHAAEHFEQGRYRQAAEHLQRLVEMGRTGRYDRAVRFDPRIIGEQAVLNLGVCYLNLGALDAAEACFGPLLGSTTLADGARHNLDLVRRRREA